MSLKTKCGVFGIFKEKNKFKNTEYMIRGLKKLQHRGRESCGISYLKKNTGNIDTVKTMGLVIDLEEKIKDVEIESNLMIGHVRYSTSGSKSDFSVIQPMQSTKLNFSLVHNGNIPNVDKLKKHLKLDLSDPKVQLMNDTSLLVYILENSESLEIGLKFILTKIPGSFSLIVMTPTELYCIRDRIGYKPLCYGKIRDGWMVASESVAIKTCYSNSVIYNVNPGEIYRINSFGSQNILKMITRPSDKLACSFEFIYFMNYKSITDGILVDDVRHEVGRYLAKRNTIKYSENAIVIGSPNSGISYGKAYAKYLKLPYVQALKKLKKERTFILPTNGERVKKIKSIVSVDYGSVVGREIILVDDSVVRGNTLKFIIELLRNNGVKKVHVKIAFPKIISPCYYGIDFPTYKELIGVNKTDDEICSILGADSLQYTNIEDLKQTIKIVNSDICTHCLTDDHNLKIYDW